MLFLSAAPGCAAKTPPAHQPVSPLSPTGEAFKIMQMSGGSDGESHLEIVSLPRTGGEAGRSVQSRLYATDVEIGDSLPGAFIDWHGVSTPRLLIVLSGELEIGLGDGSKHVMRKGDVVLAADVTGRGHTSRTIGTEPVRILTVRLPKENSLAPKLNSCPAGVPEAECVSAQLQKNAEAAAAR
ncbi:cupin domain-containing protein [Sphingobium boeckii]|uniref:Cupin type-2 domain-containing protein n=1 Tax=Sphingobium boeckii TaxID=1082345 RepID=A0A7W9AJ37_9SPHN|nr:hypothetical protein [Sphingobium boeckii]